MNINDVLTIVLSIVAIFVAYHFGDLAGTKHLIQHEDRQAEAKRKRTIKGLLAHVHSLQEINKHNQIVVNPKNDKRHVLPIQYPTTPFDLALFSIDNIDVTQTTINNVVAFVTKAEHLNVLIEMIQRVYPQQHDGAGTINIGDTIDHLLRETGTMEKLIEILQTSLSEDLSE